MSRRKTVKVAQLEGRADGYADIRTDLGWLLDGLVREHPGAKNVVDRLRSHLFEKEIETLREITKAQRSQEDES